MERVTDAVACLGDVPPAGGVSLGTIKQIPTASLAFYQTKGSLKILCFVFSTYKATDVNPSFEIVTSVSEALALQTFPTPDLRTYLKDLDTTLNFASESVTDDELDTSVQSLVKPGEDAFESKPTTQKGFQLLIEIAKVELRERFQGKALDAEIQKVNEDWKAYLSQILAQSPIDKNSDISVLAAKIQFEGKVQPMLCSFRCTFSFFECVLG